MAQLVECLTSAQVMISRFVSLSPALGSVLTAQSLEATSDSVSHSLSAPPLLVLCLSLSFKMNKHIKKIMENGEAEKKRDKKILDHKGRIRE